MFARDKGMFNRFVGYAERNGVKSDWSGINLSRHIMEAQLRAYIARNSELDSNAFYYFIYPIDETLRKAVETLKNKEREKCSKE